MQGTTTTGKGQDSTQGASAPNTTYAERRQRVFAAINAERERQKILVRSGKIRFDLSAALMYGANERWILDTDRLPVLIEECGEVAKAVHEKDGAATREELIHVAAVAVAWLENIYV